MIFGTGIDILEVDRMARTLSRTPRFTDSVFTAGEVAYCGSAANAKVRAQRFAARFAAKEAFLKAMGTGLVDGISWQDITVTRNEAGKPELQISGIARIKMEEKGITALHLSLTHSRAYAAAVVILEQLN